MEDERRPIARQRTDVCVHLEELGPVAAEIHVTNDLVVDQDLVGQRRTVEPGMQFACDRAAANDFPSLEDDRPQAGPGKVESGYQAVVTRTDDCDVVQDSLLSSEFRNRTPRLPASAARDPRAQ